VIEKYLYGIIGGSLRQKISDYLGTLTLPENKVPEKKMPELEHTYQNLTIPGMENSGTGKLQRDSILFR
jgi:hypothetical protein